MISSKGLCANALPKVWQGASVSSVLSREGKCGEAKSCSESTCCAAIAEPDLESVGVSSALPTALAFPLRFQAAATESTPKPGSDAQTGEARPTPDDG